MKSGRDELGERGSDVRFATQVENALSGSARGETDDVGKIGGFHRQTPRVLGPTIWAGRPCQAPTLLSIDEGMDGVRECLSQSTS
jgi:hypothetical protein